jgi:hypothetical protein
MSTTDPTSGTTERDDEIGSDSIAMALVQRAAARRRLSRTVFHEAMADIPVVPARALFWVALNRAIQVLEFGILVYAVGAAFSLGRALLGQAISLVGGSAGDLIPGQVGTTDGAFALAAPMLGISAASAVGVAVMVHCMQLFWTLVGAALPLAWRDEVHGIRAAEAPEEGAPQTT